MEGNILIILFLFSFQKNHEICAKDFQILHHKKPLVAKMHIPCGNLIYAYVICNLQFELNLH
jgi:hypothetical protein